MIVLQSTPPAAHNALFNLLLSPTPFINEEATYLKIYRSDLQVYLVTL